MINTVTALAAGFLLDSIIGDSSPFIHPVRIIGYLIGALEKLLYRDEDNSKAKKRKGLLLVIIVIIAVPLAVYIIIKLSYLINYLLGVVIETLLVCYALAAKSLKDESMKVFDQLDNHNLDESRRAVSMIVGRDTASLSKEGVIKATVETIAENTSDGIIAPMFYMLLGGPVAGYLYKAINTMDSMIGYKNDRYCDFGYAAAKLDDIANYIPSRLSAIFMIAASFLCTFDYRGAVKIFKRDRFNHKSPNSAQTEAVMAGALGIRLAGPASYFGQIIEKPYIGDEVNVIKAEDIVRANHLMYVTTVLFFLFGVGILCMAAIFTGIV